MEVMGDREIIDLLNNIAPREANKLLKSSVRGVASSVRTEARASVPKKSGNLARSIMVKLKRSQRGHVRYDVRVRAGKAQKNDGFYWRFLEYGTQFISERAYFRRAAEKLRPNLVPIFRRQFGLKLEAALRRKGRRRGS